MRSIVTYYEILPDGTVKKPPLSSQERLRAFWQSAGRIARGDLDKVVIRREDSILEGDIEAKRAFFEGAVKYFYTAQQLEREPTNTELQKYREIILNELLSYTYTAPRGLPNAGKEMKGRVSTTAFNAQKWETFFETAREVLFEPAGFEFPDRGEFKKMVTPKSEGGLGMTNEQATRTLRARLTQKIKAKKIDNLRQQLEYERMQYKVAQEHPTDTEQYRRALAEHAERIRQMERELDELEGKKDFV